MPCNTCAQVRTAAASGEMPVPALQPATEGNNGQKTIAPATGNKRTSAPTALDENQQEEAQPNPPKKAKTQQKKTKTSARPEVMEATTNPGPQLGEEAQEAKLPVPEMPAKRKRRTKAEMEVARAQEAAEKKKKEDAEKARRQELEEMNRKADTDRQTLAVKTVYRLSDLHAEESGSAEEFPEFYEVHGSSDDSEDEGSGSPKSTYQKLQCDNDTLQRKLKHLQKSHTEAPLGDKKTGRNGGKQIPLVSGLRNNWESHTLGSKLPTAGRSKGSAAKEESPGVIISAHGGLQDEDIVAEVSPHEQEKPAAQGITPRSRAEEKIDGKSIGPSRDVERQNGLVGIAENNVFVPPTTQRAPKVTTVQKKKLPAGNCQAVVRKAGQSTKHSTKSPEPQEVSQKKPKGKLIGSAVQVSDLPEFATMQWRQEFLPTLYDKFFASNEPFEGFFKGSQGFVELLQTVVEEVYPLADYKVTRIDAIHYLSYNRINEKRSSIASSAISLVRKHTDGMEDPADIKKWA